VLRDRWPGAADGYKDDATRAAASSGRGEHGCRMIWRRIAGGGFWAGASAGVAVCAAALLGLALVSGSPSPRVDAPEAAPTPPVAATGPAGAPLAPASPEPTASAGEPEAYAQAVGTPEADVVATAPTPDAGAPTTGETTPPPAADATPQADAPAPAGEPATPPPAADTATPAPDAAPAAQAPDAAPATDAAAGIAAAQPDPAPSQASAPAPIIAEEKPGAPAWRRNAAPFDPPSPDAPLVAIVLIDATDDGATLGAPVTIAVSTAAGAEAARAHGLEVIALSPQDVLTQGATGAEAMIPRAAGVVIGEDSPLDDPEAVGRLLASISEAGLMALDAGSGPWAVMALARSARMPVARARFRLGESAGATLTFQTLQEAARMAARDGSAVVMLSPGPETLASLRRWIATQDVVTLAPLSAVVARSGPTRY